MYSDVFCKVYNEFGWNYYPEVFGEQLLQWLRRHDIQPETAMDLACGTGILCEILRKSGIRVSGMDLSRGMIEIAREGNPEIHYDVADMITYRPDKQFDLVTCTGDALNHIGDLADVEKIFRNVYAYTGQGGYFIFDILNENEVSTSEPFEMDFSETIRVWFQMTRPSEKQVNLKIRVYENGELSFEENIRETIHDPAVVCGLLRKCGFEIVKCADRLLDDGNHGTTWFVIARKTGITKEQYLNDPCRAASIPYWKAVCVRVPENMKILHEDDFHAGMLENYIDEPYFRLRHDLQAVEPMAVPEGYSLCQGTAEEFATHIHQCYGNGMTPTEICLFAEREVYCAELWLALRADETGKIVATGIGELDKKMGEGILEWIQVSEDHRGSGLGSYIVRELLWRMKDKAKFATVSGQCRNPTNPEGLYRKCGFTGKDVWHILRKR